MGNVSLEVYLFFDGKAKEAMEFYKSIFGGELTLQTMGDIPSNAEERKMVNDENKNMVMHAKLTGGDINLMASDSPNASPKSAKIELSLTGDDEVKLRKIFDGLGGSGQIKMPLSKMYWGDTFGNLTDKYGIEWMVNISPK